MRPVFYSPAPRPADEHARQAAVDASGVVDRVDDPALQALVEEAATLFAAPIAGLTIIDRHRQHAIGRVAIPPEAMSRAASFCAHAILTPAEPLVVPDALLDRRFAGNPLVQGPPGLRFYAGAPLVDAQGLALGALCVADERPRGMPPPQLLSRLVMLARAAMSEIAAGRRDQDDTPRPT